MLFTIAIPTYNNARTVSKAIESALNQDYNEYYEILIVNNASKDNTKEVLASYSDSKIRVVTNPEMVDLFANHNVCFQEAKGDYVLFCHSDDKLLPHALSVCKQKIEQRLYPKRYILCGRSMYLDFTFSTSVAAYQLNTIAAGIKSLDCFLRGGLTPSGTCYSRKSILEIGGFPKMKSRLTPLDWYILVVAAFNYFEFEMTDRLFFVREFASTASASVPKEQDRSAIAEFLAILKERLPQNQYLYFMHLLYCNTNEYLFYYVKNHFSKIQVLKLKVRLVLRNLHNPRFCIRTLFL